MKQALRAIATWFEQLWWAHHNARVLADMEWRMILLVENATGGRMSKAYYSTEQMNLEVEAARQETYREGYDDALEEHGITRGDAA